MSNSKSLAAGMMAITLILTGASFALEAQEIRSNEKGEKITVNPDGSWQYFNVFGPTEEIFQTGMRGTTPQQLAEKYPVFNGEISPMDLAFSIPESYARSIAVRSAQVASEARAIAQKRAFVAQLQREKLEKDLASLIRTNAPEVDIRFLKYKIQAAKASENGSQLEAIYAGEAVAAAEQLTPKGVYLNKMRSEQRRREKYFRNAPFEEFSLQNSEFIAGLVLAGNDTDLPAGVNEAWPNTPSPECMVSFEGMDPIMQQHRREVQKQTLFTFTDNRLRPILKEKEYLQCRGNISSLGNQKFISLEFSFAYPNSREAYGFIEKGSILTVKLLNGEYVNLRSGKMDRGSFDTDTNLLTYNVNYPIDESQINLLRSNELDSILVFWSSGFEEYEVFEVDFFINQFACLEK